MPKPVQPIRFDPIATLLPPDRQDQLARLSDRDRQMFKGRVLESILANPAYQQVVFAAARAISTKLRAEAARKVQSTKPWPELLPLVASYNLLPPTRSRQ